MPRTRKSSSTYYQFHDKFEDDTSFDGAKSEIQPLQRNAANARERSRMRVLSSAFGRLKTKLPNIPPDTKLSKLDTLRLATLYIKQLKTLAEDVNLVANPEKGVHFETPVQIENIKPPHFQNFNPNMTWPFAFQHIHITNRNIEPNLSVTNWEEVSENLQDKSNRKSNMSSLNEVIRSPDLFENTNQINTKTPDSSNCFNCIQSQQQISPFIIRTHYNYHPPYCSDQQHQDIQINL